MSGSTLRLRECRALLAALDRLYEPVLPSEFPNHLFAILSELLPGTLNTFDSLELATGRAESHISPDVNSIVPVAQVEPAVRAYLWQNPVLGPLTSQPASVVRLGDGASPRDFHRTDLYHHCFRPLDIKHQLAAGLGRAGYASGFAVNRGGSRDFTPREVELVRRLRPHVERAHARTLLVADLRQQWVPATAPAPNSRAPEASLSELTTRETEVLHWMAEGKRDGEIATILGIAPRTANKHVEHILGKLGVETRTAAAALVRPARWLQG